MKHIAQKIGIFFGLALFAASLASADQIPVGYISWDVSFPPNAGEFDIINLSGPNSVAAVFPISTELGLTDLSLVVNFSDGSKVTEPSTYFTLSPDGESFNGTSIPIGGTNPQPTSATLTGMFSTTTINVTGTGTVTIEDSFTTTFSDTPNLVDGDLGVIYATTCTDGSCGGPAVPEPSMWVFSSLALIALLIVNRMRTRRTKVNA